MAGMIEFDVPKADNGATTLAPVPFRLRDPATIPPRQWLYGRHYIRKFVSCTVGGGGVGKTSLDMVEAVAMASGRPLLGIEVAHPLKVWVFNLEDPLEEMERRLAAICLHYGITESELGGRLFYHSGRDQRLVIARQDQGRTVVTPMSAVLTSAVIQHGIDVVQVDPFIACHEVPENDNGGIAVVATQWAQVAHDANCAVELSHHVRKIGAQNPSIEDARGAKALLDASRAARRLVRMTDDEAARAGIEPDQAWRYSRESDGKENLAPPDRAHSWRKLESVELGNGDNIGVQTPWKWPDAFSDVTVADLLSVQRLVDAGRYRDSSQAKAWVGNAVAEALDLDLDDKHQREKVKTLLKEWRKNHALDTYEDHDENREMRKFVRVGKWANES
jgi:hypothetical protein